MGKRYNPENFVDRVYMDSKFAELRTELITYFDGRLRELQEMINTESEPPAEKKEDSRAGQKTGRGAGPVHDLGNEHE